MANKIVDVSNYNGVVRWDILKEKGVAGGILKIVDRDLNRDVQFDNNYQGCNENQMPWGVYNYTYAVTVKKVIADMTIICNILDKIDKNCFKLGVWFDLEDGIQAVLSKSKIAEIINAAQETVEERGYPFGVYMGMAFYVEHIDPNLVKCDNWWIARYYKGYTEMKFSANPNESYKPAVVEDLFAWQYTSSGTFGQKVSDGDYALFDFSVQYRNLEEKVGELTGYSGIFPALPPRGYYQLGDGYETLTNYKTQIKRVQSVLNWAMDAEITVDGKYGEKTTDLEERFQKKFGLPVNGKFGDKSLAVVKSLKK